MVAPAYASVPRIWPNATVVCMATGPSLCQADVDQCRGQHVIAVNDAVRLAPWADVLYACDPRWWNYHQGVPTFTGLKFTLVSSKWPGMHVLRNTGFSGLERDPSGLRTGNNSGYQALNLAVHLGASRIVLLGYDMGHGPKEPIHFFGKHPPGLHVRSNFERFIQNFKTLPGPLQELGVEVINCSRSTALTMFPRASLDAVLQQVAA